MDERLQIKELVARLGERDGLERPKDDKVPVSPEEEHILNEIARLHKIPARAKVWRWLLANYARLEWSERLVSAARKKKQADAELQMIMDELTQ